MNTWKVYKHTNLVNGKVYIGITSGNPQHRWNGGRGYKGAAQIFQRYTEVWVGRIFA